jgi:IS5 family transposase
VRRWFCRVYFLSVPDKTTLIRWTHTLQSETLHQLNDRVVQLAVPAKVPKGRKLRWDATGVPTTIQQPTDSGPRVDSVRGLSRLGKQAQPLVQGQLPKIRAACGTRARPRNRTNRGPTSS